MWPAVEWRGVKDYLFGILGVVVFGVVSSGWFVPRDTPSHHSLSMTCRPHVLAYTPAYRSDSFLPFEFVVHLPTRVFKRSLNSDTVSTDIDSYNR